MNIESIIHYACFAVCAVHSVIQLIVSIKQGRKIKKICDKCYMPIFEEQKHICTGMESFIDTIKRG